tara:strand:- start:1942 stop:2301 length:360 start_codon:yes stop_codon:yes gene_type:complete
MSNEEEMRENMLERADGWLETPPENATDDDIQDVERFSARLRNAYNERTMSTLYSLIKGHRNTITLNEEEMAKVAIVASNLLNIFEGLPNLSIPRDKTIENLEKSVIKALKVAKGENSV